MKDTKNIHAAKMSVVALSVVSNTVLVIFKLIVGLAIGSVSVLSEAIHSGLDLAAALIAYFAVRSAAKPADEHHHYGHGKFENVSGFVEAILIFVAAAWIIFEAVKKLLHPDPIEMIGWGVVVMGLSSAVNIVVSNMLFKVGNATDSIAIKADAWHLRTDVYTSMGVMVGLGLIWVIEQFWVGHHVHWLDPVIAIMVALMIMHAAYELTMQSLGDLLDGALPQDHHDKVEAIIKRQKGVLSFKHLRTRKSGPTKFIEFDMLVAGDMTVQDAHAMADTITEDIERALSNSRVTIHVEPCDRTCSTACMGHCTTPPHP